MTVPPEVASLPQRPSPASGHRPLRVLMTHDRFLPDFAGGGELIVFEQARHLARLGVEIRVLTVGDPGIREHQGIPTRRLRMHRYLFNLASGEIAREARWADLIHTFNYHAALPSLVAARRLGKPVVCTMLGLCGDSWLDLRGRLAGRAWRAWERWLLRRPFSRTVFLSDYSREEGVALGVDPRRTGVTCPGVDLDLYDATREKEDVVLFAARLDARKGIREVLAAAAALPDVRFRLVGWGPDAEALRRQATANVEFAGFASGPALHDHFARARVFLLPSRGETFGLALVEAMASGCAVVSSIPLPFAGERVTFGDRAGIAAALRRLWDAPEECRRLGRTNAEMARVYTWERYAELLVDAYRELMGPGAPRVGPRSELELERPRV